MANRAETKSRLIVRNLNQNGFGTIACMNYHTMVLETRAIRVAALAHLGDYARIGSAFGQLTAMAAGMSLRGPATRTSLFTTTIHRRRRGMRFDLPPA
jgi:hypothetical protein